MARGKAATTPAVDEQPAEVVDEQLADDEQTTEIQGEHGPELDVPEQTTDYTRRAGGYVLTDRGWVIENS